MSRYSATSDGAGRYRLVPQAGAQRAQTEIFIAERFRAVHDAHIREFMPTLLATRDGDGKLTIACGLRDAGTARPLFLELYLDDAVEHVLSRVLSRAVARHAIVEVGNLAVVPPATARTLIGALSRFLADTGFEWTVFTGVRSLRNAFHRLGVPLVDLGAARIDCLPSELRDDWGAYYRDDPRVCAVSVRAALDTLNLGRREAA